jgi:hypothetical protein
MPLGYRAAINATCSIARGGNADFGAALDRSQLPAKLRCYGDAKNINKQQHQQNGPRRPQPASFVGAYSCISPR